MIFGMQQIQKLGWLKNGPDTLLLIYCLQVHKMYFTNSNFCEPTEIYKRIYEINQLIFQFQKSYFITNEIS